MLKQSLENLKITALNEMQHAALAAAKKGNMILLSPTGSGKTLGFLLPLLNLLDAKTSTVQVLILVPSRELALQIEQVFKTMGTGFKVNCCYGGHPVKIERNNLSQPPAVLIGTPGRIAHHLRRHSFSRDTVHTLILDEFDKSLEFGFQEDMEYIIKQLPALKKRILTSATQMREIPDFTGINNSVEVNFLDDKTNAPDIVIKAVISPAADKLETLFSLICKIGDGATLVFCNHREAVERISDLLWDMGLVHDVFHGGMEQEDRERALLKFRNGSHRLLITTDLAARKIGMDPIEIRRRNLTRDDAYPCASASGLKFEAMSHHASLDKLLSMMDLPALRADQAAARKKGIHRGIGFATFIEITNPGPAFYGVGGARISSQDGASVKLDATGNVTVQTSITEQGQGSAAIIAQVTATAIGVPLERVKVILGDTDNTPYGGGTWASRGAGIGGEAAFQAGRALRENILKLAGTILQARPEALDICAGKDIL